MSVVQQPPPPPATADAGTSPTRTIYDVQRELGGVPLNRIVIQPSPGTATEADMLRLNDHHDILAELVNGTLVRKEMGFWESRLLMKLARVVGDFVEQRKLGVIAGEGGMLQMAGGNVRIPDMSFIRTEDLPVDPNDRQPVPRLRPTIAVEVLSASNTDDELTTKIAEYFESGCELIWLVNPADRSVRIYESPDAPNRFRQITAADTLDGGSVLPGFKVNVAEIFEV